MAGAIRRVELYVGAVRALVAEEGGVLAHALVRGRGITLVTRRPGRDDLGDRQVRIRRRARPDELCRLWFGEAVHAWSVPALVRDPLVVDAVERNGWHRPCRVAPGHLT